MTYLFALGALGAAATACALGDLNLVKVERHSYEPQLITGGVPSNGQPGFDWGAIDWGAILLEPNEPADGEPNCTRLHQSGAELRPQVIGLAPPWKPPGLRAASGVVSLGTRPTIADEFDPK